MEGTLMTLMTQE